MYSPKIKEEFIPRIYRIAKSKGTRMTVLVNEIIERALKEIGDVEEDVANNKPAKGVKR